MIRVPPLALPLLSQLALCRRRMSTSCDESVSRHYPMSPWGKTTPAESHGGGAVGRQGDGEERLPGQELGSCVLVPAFTTALPGFPPPLQMACGHPPCCQFPP